MNLPATLQPSEYREVIQRLRRRFLTPLMRQRTGLRDLYLGAARPEFQMPREGTGTETGDHEREDFPKQPVQIGDQPSLAVVFQIDRAEASQPAGSTALPTQVSVYVYRNGRRRLVRLPGNIEEAGEIVPSGRWIVPKAAGSGSRRVTCGCVVKWQVQLAEGSQDYWGVLTVGHAWGELPVGPEQIEMTIMPRFGQPISGRLLTSTQRQGLDAALVLVDRAALLSDGIDVTRRQRWLTWRELAEDYRRAGMSLDVVHDGVAIQAETPPQPRMLGVLGLKEQIIQVRSTEPQAFQPGSSGTIWLLRDADGSHALAAMQLATRADDFSIGYGQVLDGPLLSWLGQAIRTHHHPHALIPGSLSLIRAF